jgi:hypothetical protein
MFGKERFSMAVRRMDREEVRTLYKQGMRCSEIAKVMGCGRPVVSKIIRGGTVKPPSVAITDVRLLFLLQTIYGDLWRLKRQDWQGAREKLVLGRLKSLIGVLDT